jgi:hypothetical protein
MVFKILNQMALVGLWHIKEDLAKAFKFSNKFPKHLDINSEDHLIYLDEHVVLKIVVHKHQGDKYGIKQMQANQRRHLEQVDRADLFYSEFDFSESDLKFIQTHVRRRVRNRVAYLFCM